MKTDLLAQAEALQPQLVAWRRDIHQHPELGFEETRTANLVANELRQLGLEVEVGVGITGVVGRLGDASEGPVIGIRADMDALPIQEALESPFASRTPGKMHACGHDAHTAILLGVAHLLTAMPDRPKGEIRFLFQPSEEKQDAEDLSGAPRMISAGALEGVDHVLALHVSSTTKTGLVEITSGAVSANVDTLFATIKGVGGHGAAPHQCIDPIFLAAQVISALQSAVSRRIDPVRPGVVTIGSIHGGDANNVIPNEVKLTGTVRSYDHETRQLLLREVENIFALTRALGGDYDLRWQHGYPSMNNDPHVSQVIEQVSGDFFGADQVKPFVPMMGGEDFSYMQQIAPGAMFMLGVQIGDDHRPHHSPIFDIDESPFYRGAAILAESACRLLQA
jgi:amidohydrolase